VTSMSKGKYQGEGPAGGSQNQAERRLQMATEVAYSAGHWGLERKFRLSAVRRHYGVAGSSYCMVKEAIRGPASQAATGDLSR
jgi:hypothetical protein